MSDEKKLSVVHHLAGLSLVAGIVVCLAALWVYGLPFLRGSVFNDLFLIIYAVVAFGFLTMADRLANALPLRR
ncbi:hypothetical protein [Ensifer soli]|uniref:hypothetical protein n=1 Tax=Ciceribacter sp. sgz301302 TaxID=3342379 RepID=UPI0035B98E6F